MSPATEHEDPRRAKSRARVLATAADVLREEGLAGLTIESVAARSGVAKTTIYRQFDDREALHVATLEMVGSTVQMPTTDDLVADVTAYCKELATKLRDGDFGGLLSTAVDGSERSPSLAATMREVAAGRRRALTQRLKSAIAGGDLPDDTDLEVLTGHLVG
ncbi:MAG: TetR/AcrR family transcriptional regulator, partial [Ilumatobacteraceae bacterium]